MPINLQATVDKLYALLEKLELQEKQVALQAERMGCKPEEVQTMQGDFLLSPILVAQAHVIESIIKLTPDWG